MDMKDIEVALRDLEDLRSLLETCESYKNEVEG